MKERVILLLLSCVLPIVLLVGCTLLGNTPENEHLGLWELKYYEDEFLDPTDVWYITNKRAVEGSWSDAASVNSKLFVKIFIDEDTLAMKLWGYGGRVIKNTDEKEKPYTVIIKSDDGTRTQYNAGISAGEEMLRFSVQDAVAIIQKLGTEDEIGFHISDPDNVGVSYIFTVQTDNFGVLYLDTKAGKTT